MREMRGKKEAGKKSPFTKSLTILSVDRIGCFKPK